jgi:hypothetical protein
VRLRRTPEETIARAVARMLERDFRSHHPKLAIHTVDISCGVIETPDESKAAA